MTMVAEGVETAEQQRLLERQGCDRMQGYFLGRPMPADDLVDRLREEQRAAAVAEELARPVADDPPAPPAPPAAPAAPAMGEELPERAEDPALSRIEDAFRAISAR
jgi:hypothetical protein